MRWATSDLKMKICSSLRWHHMGFPNYWWYDYFNSLLRLKHGRHHGSASLAFNEKNPLVTRRFPQVTLQRRHNGRDSVSYHQPHDCFLIRSFRRRSREHQSSALLAFVRGIHGGPVNSPHKWPVTRKMFPFDDVIMNVCNAERDSMLQRHCVKWLSMWPSISFLILELSRRVKKASVAIQQKE